MSEDYVTRGELLQLAHLLRRTSDEEREKIRGLSWEVSKLAFYVAVLRKAHPDHALWDRARAAIERAEENPDRVEALKELFSTSVLGVLDGT